MSIVFEMLATSKTASSEQKFCFFKIDSNFIGVRSVNMKISLLGLKKLGGDGKFEIQFSIMFNLTNSGLRKVETFDTFFEF